MIEKKPSEGNKNKQEKATKKNKKRGKNQEKATQKKNKTRKGKANKKANTSTSQRKFFQTLILKRVNHMLLI